MCGKCCHDLNLSLTIDEAIEWIEDGAKVVVFCEATPWTREPPSTDARAAHIKRRSFAATSGAANIRVTALLIAVISGPCRNLGADLKCKIYERRPLVCRIYPAEINPFTNLEPRAKSCPPEAWQSDKPLLSGGVLVDRETSELIERSRRTDAADAPSKGRLCNALGIRAASVKEEGFAIHEFDQRDLLDTLRRTKSDGGEDPGGSDGWKLHTPWPSTFDRLRAVGIDAFSMTGANDTFKYVAIGAAPPSISRDAPPNAD